MDVESIIKEAYKVGMKQVPEEISGLVNFLKDKDIKNVLEIGSFNGGSFYIWCNIADGNGIKISLDLPEMSSSVLGNRNRKMKTWGDNIYVVVADSHDENVFSQIEDILKGEEVDLLFIDGDHKYDGVKKDYELYKGLVREGGYIVFHDIVDTEFHRSCNCNVSQLWGEIKGEKIEFNDNHSWGGIGVIKKVDDSEIFVIGAWVKTEKQKNLLKECISKARECDAGKILLVTHCAIDADIIEMVDYFIYDRENPVLNFDDFSRYDTYYGYSFWKDEKYEVVKTLSFDYQYAVWTSMKNAFNFVKYLGKERIYYLEYDVIVDCSKFRDNFINPLESHDCCIALHDDNKSCLTTAFSIKTDLGLSILNSFNSFDDYFSNKGNVYKIEELFYKLLVSKKRKLNFYSHSFKDLMGSCDILDNIKYNRGSFVGFILPCRDTYKNVYLSIIYQNIQPKVEPVRIFVDFLGKTETFFMKRNYLDISVVKILDASEINNCDYLDKSVLIHSEDEIICKYRIGDIFADSEECRLTL